MSNIPFHNDSINLNTLWFESHKGLIENIAVELDQIDQIDHLITKFLGEPMKIKKLKDPLRPKKAKSAYLYFCDEIRPQIKKDNPSLQLGEMMKEISKKWKVCTEEEKEKYNNLHIQDRERYEEEMENYSVTN